MVRRPPPPPPPPLFFFFFFFCLFFLRWKITLYLVGQKRFRGTAVFHFPFIFLFSHIVLSSLSRYASENAVAAGGGRFFDDYVNWSRIPEYEQLVRESPAAEIAAAVRDFNYFFSFFLSSPTSSLSTDKTRGSHVYAPALSMEVEKYTHRSNTPIQRCFQQQHPTLHVND
jgi:hypothetical protein